VDGFFNDEMAGTDIYTVSGTLDPNATGTLTNIATVLPPAGVTDPNTGNNTAIDEDTIVPVSDLSLNKTFTYTNTIVGMMEAKAVDFDRFRDELKATDPIVEFRTEAKMQMVVSCQRPFDMWNVGGRVFQNVLKEPKLATALKMGHYKEGQVMLGNQAAVVKGGPHPNAGKLFIEFLLSKEGADIFVEGEGVYTFRKDYTPPAAVKPYLLDLSEEKLVGLNDWVGAQKEFKDVHDAWEKRFK
jgi:hypothetical protein